jgi:hypothetical protein
MSGSIMPITAYASHSASQNPSKDALRYTSLTMFPARRISAGPSVKVNAGIPAVNHNVVNEHSKNLHHRSGAETAAGRESLR